MSNYENTNHRIRKNWENSQTNESTIKDQQGVKVLKDGQVVQLRNTNSIFNRTIDLSTNWTPMAPAFFFISDGTFSDRVINWVVTANIPEDAITLTKFAVEYRLISDENPFFGVGILYQDFTVVEDLNNSNLKKVTWYVGWSLEFLNVEAPDFEARLSFTLPNPNLYI